MPLPAQQPHGWAQVSPRPPHARHVQRTGLRVLLGDERAAHPFDGRRHRREVDDDLVGEPPPIVANLIVATHRDRRSAEAAEGVPLHELLLR